MHVSDSASNFLSVFNAEAVEKIAFDMAEFNEDYPSETFPSFSADLTDANPREAGVASVLEGQAEALGVPVGTISISMASDLSIESLQGLSVIEALAVMDAAANAPSIEDITVADTAEQILENKSHFDVGGALEGLSPDSVAAENVSRDDINEVIGSTVNDIALIGSVELSGEGDLASPVDIETALNLLDARVVNSPASSELSVEDTGSAIIAAENALLSGDLFDVITVTAVDVNASQLADLVDYPFLNHVAISDGIAELETLAYGTDSESGRPSIIPDAITFTIHAEDATVSELETTAVPYGSMDVLDSVQNVVTALRSEGNSEQIVSNAGSITINGPADAPISFEEMVFLEGKVASFPDDIQMAVADTAGALSSGFDSGSSATRLALYDADVLTLVDDHTDASHVSIDLLREFMELKQFDLAGSDFDIVDSPVEILSFLKSNDADKGDILAAVDDIEINANSVLNLNVADANVLATTT